MGGRQRIAKLSTRIGLAMAILASAVLLVRSLLAAPDEHTAVATVNGDIVSPAELAYFAGLRRASVIEAFLAEEGARMDDGFWHRESKGTTPLEMLREQALQDAAVMKTELQLARELGLASDISFEALLDEMEAENARRAKAAANGEPLYGPGRFEERSFIDWYRSKLAASAKERWAERALIVDERELRSFYAELGTSLTPMEGELTYERFVVAYRQDGEEDVRGKEVAYRAAAAVRVQLLNGVAAADAAGAAGTEDIQGVKSGITVVFEGESVLSDRNASRMYKSDNALYTALKASTKEQPVTAVIDDPASGCYIIARVTAIRAAEAPAFDEVRDMVRKLYVEEKYSAYLDSRMESISIERLPGYYEAKLDVE